MNEDKRSAISWQQRLNEELDLRKVHFTPHMESQVLERIRVNQSSDVHRAGIRESAPSAKTSFWNREVRIPIPVVVVPIVMIAIFGLAVLAQPTTPNTPTDKTVRLPSGIFSIEQLTRKG